MKVKDLLELLQNYSPEQEILDVDFNPADVLEIDGELIVTSRRECYEI